MRNHHQVPGGGGGRRGLLFVLAPVGVTLGCTTLLNTNRNVNKTRTQRELYRCHIKQCLSRYINETIHIAINWTHWSKDVGWRQLYCWLLHGWPRFVSAIGWKRCFRWLRSFISICSYVVYRRRCPQPSNQLDSYSFRTAAHSSLRQSRYLDVRGGDNYCDDITLLDDGHECLDEVADAIEEEFDVTTVSVRHRCSGNLCLMIPEDEDNCDELSNAFVKYLRKKCSSEIRGGWDHHDGHYPNVIRFVYHPSSWRAVLISSQPFWPLRFCMSALLPPSSS